MQKSLEVLQGTVKKVISQKEGWICFTLSSDLFLEVTVTLAVQTTISKGEEVRVFGKFVEHPTWGQQFKASKIELLSFKTKDAAREFLTFLLPSLSKEALDKVLSTYGEKAVSTLEKDLDLVSFLSIDQKNYIRSKLAAYKNERESLEFLFDLNLNTSLCARAIEVFGGSVIQKIKEDPYCLLEIEDFPFQEADQVAQRFGVAQNSLDRISAVVFHLLDAVIPTRGHIFSTMSDLFSEIESFNDQLEPIPNDKETIFKALKMLRDKGRIIVESKRLYSKKWFNYEENSAQLFVKFLGNAPLKTNIEKFLREYEVRFNTQFSLEQEEAIKALATSKVFVITGYPGTGKTFITKVIVDILKRERLSFALLTPTGISAKKLSLITGEEAGTIHRKLGYTGRLKPWAYNKSQKFAVDAVIIDESSMVDQEVFYRMLEALPETARLIFIGDVAQLPSVGPGNILHDLINSDCIKVISLTHIYRQSEGSAIKINAKKIHEGLMIDTNEKSHFYFIQETDHEKILKTILFLAQKFKDKDCQILSPKKASLIGTYSLNKSLKEVLNPPIDEKLGIGRQEVSVSKGLNFRVDDKVMVTRNDYEKGVFNGDCGKILNIDLSKKELGFLIEGSPMVYVYSFEEAKTRLQLAFSITIHKSQGLEYDIVIFPYTKTFYNQLHRNLLYTAVTRASKQVFIIGDVQAVDRAIKNNKIIKRNTFLADRIKSKLSSNVKVITETNQK